jgi:hypothetical protein
VRERRQKRVRPLSALRCLILVSHGACHWPLGDLTRACSPSWHWEDRWFRRQIQAENVPHHLVTGAERCYWRAHLLYVSLTSHSLSPSQPNRFVWRNQADSCQTEERERETDRQTETDREGERLTLPSVDFSTEGFVASIHSMPSVGLPLRPLLAP